MSRWCPRYIPHSPGGHYIICVDPFEAGPYRWVETPKPYETAIGHVLFDLTDRCGQVDSADWVSESRVLMHAGTNPDGNACEVAVDCVRPTASVNGKQLPLGGIEDARQRAV
jgi:hypothetical protein